MKKALLILAIALAPLFAQTVWNGTANTAWYNATASTFTITTAEQLAGFAKLVNEGNTFNDKMIKLGANIRLNDTTSWQNWKNAPWSSEPPTNTWTPIGVQGNLFGGTFDGNGFVVSGIYINTTNNVQGLFRAIVGTIMNVGISAFYIKGGSGVGGLLGSNNGGTISNSYSSGEISGEDFVGGLVGQINDSDGGTISNSYSTSKVIGKNTVGGLVGSNNGGTINNSYSFGSVIGINAVGGLVGQNLGTISNSYSRSTVAPAINSLGKFFGGFVGWNNGGTISDSYYDKEIGFNAGEGEGKTTEEMKVAFDGWDFNKIWNIKNTINCGYPYLLENKGRQICQDSLKYQQLIALLKANELEKCYDNCIKLESKYESDKKIKDLCEKQLVDKIKKTPKNKITPKIAHIYYNSVDNCEVVDDNCKVVGNVIQNKGGIILLNSFFQEYIGDRYYMYETIMIQTSGHIIGGLNACTAPGTPTHFSGNVKYIGKKTYTTILGEQKTVPNFQLLWCDAFLKWQN